MGRIYQSLKLRLIAICVIALAAVFSIVHIAVYLTTKNTIEEQIQQGAQAIAIAVAHYIMEDTEAYESFI
ncbi:MAG: hypothetical protein LBI05_05400, partial [Planctomycetaceae bacterium]|nr:hypothetical protein [Planctomycetaceae bacterium]